jgi:hypothetical protein
MRICRKKFRHRRRAFRIRRYDVLHAGHQSFPTRTRAKTQNGPPVIFAMPIALSSLWWLLAAAILPHVLIARILDEEHTWGVGRGSGLASRTTAFAFTYSNVPCLLRPKWL